MKILYDDNGEGWEKYAPYEFSDDGNDWNPGLFSGFTGHNVRRWRSVGGESWRCIRVCQTPVVAGKKHKKPVELKKGDCCKWTSYHGAVLLGWYMGVDEDGLILASTCGGSVHNLGHENISDIKRMVEAEDD